MLGSDFLDDRLGLSLLAGCAAGRGRLLGGFRPCGGVNVTQEDRDQRKHGKKDHCPWVIHRRHRRAAGGNTPPSSSPAPPPSAEPYRRTVVRRRHRRTDCRASAIFDFSDSVGHAGRTANGKDDDDEDLDEDEDRHEDDGDDEKDNGDGHDDIAAPRFRFVAPSVIHFGGSVLKFPDFDKMYAVKKEISVN